MARRPQASASELAGLWSQALGDYRAGRQAEAAAGFEAILARAPDHAPSWHLLGLIQFARGAHDDAVRSIGKAVAAEPGLAQAWNDLAVILQRRGRNEEAVAHYRRAIALAPDRSIWHFNLGSALQAQGKFDPAIAAYRQALALKPDDPATLNNLANALMDQGKSGAAAQCYRRAVTLDPDYAEAFSNLGNALMRIARYDQGFDAFRRALELKPDYAGGYVNLANAELGFGRLDRSIELFRKALVLKPDYPEVESNVLLTLNYLARSTPEAIYRAHRAWAEAHAPQPDQHPFANAPEPERRLRVGYVSADFYHHSVAYFLEPLLAAHDRRAVEIFCYADVKQPDATTARLEALADRWCSTLGMSDADLARRIRDDGIDLLVDLAGHTGLNRIRVFALKPAPVALTWCGYPNTTGLAAIDYRITDPRADPEGEADRLHAERLVRLPTSFLCYRPAETAPEVAPPPVRATGHITFGSFNNLAKVQPETARVWARILEAVPGARLVLKAGLLWDDQALERLMGHFLAHFSAAGIPRERIEFLGRTSDAEEHLALYRRIDIALDPFPYNGTATTCEALWMGVPVITLTGDRHAGRVGTSLLTTLGLPDLIAASVDDYVARAASLARDLDRLAGLRATLRDRMRTSYLCDGAHFAREMEAAYRSMWRRWCGSRNP